MAPAQGWHAQIEKCKQTYIYIYIYVYTHESPPQENKSPPRKVRVPLKSEIINHYSLFIHYQRAQRAATSGTYLFNTAGATGDTQLGHLGGHLGGDLEVMLEALNNTH